MALSSDNLSTSESTLPGRRSCLIETPGLIETGTMLVTYPDQFIGVPPHGVFLQCPVPQAAVIPQFCSVRGEGYCDHSCDISGSAIFPGKGLDIWLYTRWGQYRGVNQTREKLGTLTPSSPYWLPVRPTASQRGHGLAIRGTEKQPVSNRLGDSQEPHSQYSWGKTWLIYHVGG